jgi:hypothetical protein
LQDALDRGGNLLTAETIGSIQDPYRLDHRDDAYKAEIALSQASFDQLGCSCRLRRIVLREVANQDVSIEADQRRLPRLRIATNPAAIASFISSTETA